MGFEPTFAFTKTVFKTVAIVHSATPPQTVLVYEINLSLATVGYGRIKLRHHHIINQRLTYEPRVGCSLYLPFQKGRLLHGVEYVFDLCLVLERPNLYLFDYSVLVNKVSSGPHSYVVEVFSLSSGIVKHAETIALL